MATTPDPAVTQALRGALDHSGDGFALFDANDRLLYANRAFALLFALDPATTPRPDFAAVLAQAHAAGAILHSVGNGGDEIRKICATRRRDRYRSYEIAAAQGTLLINESLGDEGLLLCLCSSQSRFTQLCRELNEQESLLQQLLLSSNQPIIISDLDDGHRIVDANDAALELLKYGRDELRAIDPVQLSAPVQLNNLSATEAATQTILQAGMGEIRVTEWLLRDANGRIIPVELQAMRVHKTGHRWIRSTLRDISAQRAALQTIASQQRHLQHLRHFDTLTELPNRVLLTEQLTLSLQNARLRDSRVALLIIDIDRFKLINDTLGYHIGDRYLVALGNLLSGLVRGSDTVGRLGADEFAVILEGCGDDGMIEHKARLILQETARPFVIDEHELATTVSIGIAIFPDHCSDADEMLRHADAALHQAKHSGKNMFAFYRAEFATHLGDQLQLASDLRRALERNEFHLVFQPQIHANTGRIFAAEVLLRWTHPTRGFISPAEFIPIAEETGLITEIGQWVLEQSLHQMQLWRDHGIRLDYIAVNISPRQFNLDRFVDRVRDITQRCQLPPQCLQLELTENLLLDSTSHTIEKLQRLAESGFSVAIDDFGTGYSSLSYLKRFPLQKLKIDRSFVADVTKDPNDAAIVRAIIAMADSLNLDVIAEGVETAEQVAFLQALGCNEIQGYYYSKPLGEQAFVDFVKNNA